MLWVTSMTLQLGAAQKTLSCLQHKHPGTLETTRLLYRNLVYPVMQRQPGCREALRCRDARDAAMAHEYFSTQEMIRPRQDDVVTAKYVLECHWNEVLPHEECRGVSPDTRGILAVAISL